MVEKVEIENVEEVKQKLELKKQKLEVAFKHLKAIYPEVTTLRKYGYEAPSGKFELYVAFNKSDENVSFDDEWCQPSESGDFYYLLFDKEKCTYFGLDSFGTIDRNGNNLGSWFTEYKPFVGDMKDSTPFSYFSGNVNDTLTVVIHDKNGEMFKFSEGGVGIYNSILSDAQDHRVIFIEDVLNKKNENIGDYYYLSGNSLLSNSASVIECMPAQKKGFYVIKENDLYKAIQMEHSKVSKQVVAKSLNDLLAKIDCLKITYDGKNYFWLESENGFSYNYVIKPTDPSKKTERRVRLSSGYFNYYTSLVDYNANEHFMLIRRNGLSVIFDIASYDRQTTSDEYHLPSELNNKEHVDIVDILRVDPKFFDYIPTHLFADKDKVESFVDAVIVGLTEKLNKKNNEDPSHFDIKKYNDYVNSIKQLISKKVVLETDYLKNQVQECYNEKAKAEEEERIAEKIAERMRIVNDRIERKLAENKAKLAKEKERNLKNTTKNINSIEEILNVYE